MSQQYAPSAQNSFTQTTMWSWYNWLWQVSVRVRVFVCPERHGSTHAITERSWNVHTTLNMIHLIISATLSTRYGVGPRGTRGHLLARQVPQLPRLYMPTQSIQITRLHTPAGHTRVQTRPHGPPQGSKEEDTLRSITININTTTRVELTSRCEHAHTPPRTRHSDHHAQETQTAVRGAHGIIRLHNTWYVVHGTWCPPPQASPRVP